MYTKNKNYCKIDGKNSFNYSTFRWLLSRVNVHQDRPSGLSGGSPGESNGSGAEVEQSLKEILF